MTIYVITYIENMRFENSIVYTFYGMYGKYTVSIKNCIYGLTYIQFILFQHKFRIFVVAYIPTLEKDGAAKRVPAESFKAGIQ